MMSLSDAKQAGVIDAFITTSRYLDYIYTPADFVCGGYTVFTLPGRRCVLRHKASQEGRGEFYWKIPLCHDDATREK